MDELQKLKRKLPKRMLRALEVSKRLHERILVRKAKEMAAQQKVTRKN